MNYGMYRGDSLLLNITVQQLQNPFQEESPSNPLVPVDLTGATLWMTAKKNITDKDERAVFQIKTPDDIKINADPTTGKAQVTVPASATQSLSFPQGATQLDLVYDIQIKTQTGIVQTVATGKLTVMEDVTGTIT